MSAALAILAADFLNMFVLGAPYSVLDATGKAALFFLLLWPLMYLREGLYPGYGITAVQGLKKQIIGAFYVGFITLGISLFLGKFILLPITFTALATLFGMVLSPLLKYSIKQLLYKLNLWGCPVVIIGANQTGVLMAEVMKSRPLVGLRPVAFFDDDVALSGTKLSGIPVMGRLEDAPRFIKEHNLQHVYVASTDVPNHGITLPTGREEHVPREVKFVPALSQLSTTQRYNSGLHNMVTLEARNNLNSRLSRAVKRTVDLFLAILALALLLPILVALYIWVKLDSRGPALYRSPRIGQQGESFDCLKFRTMALDADAQLQTLLERDSERRREYEQFHKLQNDPRITRAGRTLRRYSLDELPQLVNVLLGQMSLVGPRPYLNSELVNIHFDRRVIFESKPGMTGHWQVSERNNISFEERLWMDEHYVRNWSVWWDLILLAETVHVVLKPNSAH